MTIIKKTTYCQLHARTALEPICQIHKWKNIKIGFQSNILTPRAHIQTDIILILPNCLRRVNKFKKYIKIYMMDKKLFFYHIMEKLVQAAY